MFYTEQDKIQRKMTTLITPTYHASEAGLGTNNLWKYHRAPIGFKFVLVQARVSNAYHNIHGNGVISLFDGRVFNTRWDIFPGVEDYQLIGRATMRDTYRLDDVIDLHGWECKEYTIASRCLVEDDTYQGNIIVWYYLKPMSRLETVMYAVLHPKRKYRHAGPTTVELTEE